MMKKILLFVLVCGLVVGCGKKDTQQTPLETYTVKLSDSSAPLYFTGSVSPIRIISVATPEAGTINQQFFHYGQQVNKNDKLFIIISTKLEENFRTAVSTYLKAMDDYADKHRKFTGSQELHHLKFISDDDYYAAQNASKESYLALLEARYKLEAIFKKAGIHEQVTKFHFDNREEIFKIFSTKHDSLIIHAPAAGIALFPSKTTERSSHNASKEISVGSEVKAGQTLLVLGDINGIKINIDVNEININQINRGEKVIVTGPAFSQYTLHGVITAVNTQAKTQASQQPTFPVTIEVPHLTTQEQQSIHVGMTAKVKVTLDQPQILSVPIAAVTHQGSQAYVQQQDPKTGRTRQVAVTTGRTTQDTVEITKGLNAGDIIVINH